MHRFVEICAHVCRVSVRISTNSLWVIQGSIRWFRIVDKEDGHGFSCLSPCCRVCLWACVCVYVSRLCFGLRQGHTHSLAGPQQSPPLNLCRSQMMNNACWENLHLTFSPWEKERVRMKKVSFEGEQNVSLKQRILSVLNLCLKQNGIPLKFNFALRTQLI